MSKRKFALFMVLFFMSVSIIIPAHAENMIRIEDSKNFDTAIADEIKCNMNTQATDDIIKIYNIGLTFAFSKHKDIKSILASEEVLGEYYAAKTTKGVYSFWIEDEGTYVPLNIVRNNQRAIDVCNSEEVVNFISDKITVLNRYYLSGESSHMGSAIYYETDKGDYVYFNHSSVGEYLFPIADFCEFQKAVLEKAQSNPTSVGGTNYSAVWDLSPYDFKSDTFNLNATMVENNHEPNVVKMLFIGVGVLAVLLITTILCFWKVRAK